ncbi:MAG: hypothetical protein JSU01_02740 [Bacteroidetes bacterium]|nr:hypothetical protein [Bacteroidota bacterium]
MLQQQLSKNDIAMVCSLQTDYIENPQRGFRLSAQKPISHNVILGWISRLVRTIWLHTYGTPINFFFISTDVLRRWRNFEITRQ